MYREFLEQVELLAHLALQECLEKRESLALSVQLVQQGLLVQREQQVI